MAFSPLCRRLTALILIILSACVSSFAREPYSRGEKSFGPRVGYVTRNCSALGGLVFQYSFSRHVRIAPEASIIFRHKNLDALSVDIDMQFPLQLESDRMAFYPILGLDFTSWNSHRIQEGTNKDVSNHVNRFGANAGAGFEIRCTPTLKIFLEAKYTLVKTYPGATVAAGLAYVF